MCVKTFFEDSLQFSNLLVGSCCQNLHQGVFISAQTLLAERKMKETSWGSSSCRTSSGVFAVCEVVKAPWWPSWTGRRQTEPASWAEPGRRPPGPTWGPTSERSPDSATRHTVTGRHRVGRTAALSTTNSRAFYQQNWFHKIHWFSPEPSLQNIWSSVNSIMSFPLPDQKPDLPLLMCCYIIINEITTVGE